MTIDFNHHTGAEIANEMFAIMAAKKELQLIEALKPIFSQDGNQYCYLYGEMPECYVVGFGDTPNMAMENFYFNFHNQKIKVAPSPATCR